MTFSELEDALGGLKSRNSMLFGNRLNAGLEEAQLSIQSLTDTVRDLLAQNQKICRRLERSDVSIQLKHQSAPSALESASCTNDDTSTLRPNRNSCGQNDVTIAVEGRPDYAFSFEQDLRQSRVYTRVSRTIARRSDPDPLSLPSSASCSIGSSIFSGLSLADVSNISLVSLPIAAHYLSNGQRYREPLTKDIISSYLPSNLLSVPRSSGKVLLLGISNAGKSTILKQLQLMQGSKPTPIELEEARAVIRTAVIDTFRRVLSDCIDKRASDTRGEAFDLLSQVSQDADKVRMSYSTQSNLGLQYSYVLHGSLKDTIPQEEYFDGALVVFNHLWEQQEIKWAINAKPWPQTPNNIPYIMDNLVDIFWGTPTHSYIANLCMHIKTNGIYKSSVTISPFEFEVYDVGGTRSCRQKWMYCMGEKPDYLIYVVDLNGYCQNLAEDLDTIQMSESLHVFESVINHDSAKDIPVFLFLNKADVFERTIVRQPISDYFEEYDGGADYFKACRFWAERFARLDHRVPGKLHCYVTNSLDSNEFQNAWRQVQERMVHTALKY
ncbi:MAG: hypothetical protein LQ343_002511 [Gyalolechia ehrenbergii]|nr:MAG: hypothetical protein LQ343_002511 [Gyalolechia ehrenbergii]